MVVCILLAAFFSLSETSLTMLNKIRLRNMLDEGEKGSKAIEKATRDPKRLLSTILVGVNTSNIVLSAVATALAINLFGDGGGVMFAVTATLTLVVLVFCDIFPKTLASGNPKRYSKMTAPFINLFGLIFAPLVFILNFVVAGPIRLFSRKEDGHDISLTESEIKTIVDIGQEEGVIEEEEHRLISSVFEFNNLRAKDIMIPRTDMVSLSLLSDYDEVFFMFKTKRVSVLPVYKEDADHIVGILYLNDLFFMDESETDGFIERHMRVPMFSYENKPLNELFREMNLNSAYMVIIVDEYGGTSGFLTIDDLINEIAGDAPNNVDDGIFKENDFEYITAGDARLEDVNEVLGINLVSDDCETIGGYVMGLLDDIPDENTEQIVEALELGIRFRVEALEKNRITKIRIIKEMN